MLTTIYTSCSGTNYSNSKETAPMTFRIDKVVLGRIRAEASHHDVSLNSFINRILKKFQYNA
jgi:predicted HicB family RNase H-like nuclease